MDPMGAPRPFEKQSDTESKQEQYSFNPCTNASRPVACAEMASQSRAPSRWSFMGGSCECAHFDIAWASDSGRIVPASVFSRQMRRVGQA